MRFYLLNRPGSDQPVVPIWAPGFDVDEHRWDRPVVCIVDAVYQNDPNISRWLRKHQAVLRATVQNPLPWVVRANYPHFLSGQQSIYIYQVPADRLDTR